MEACPRGCFMTKGPVSHNHCLTFPWRAWPNVVLHADLVFKGVLRGVTSLGSLTLQGWGNWGGGQLGQHLTYLLVKLPGIRKLMYVLEAGLEPGFSGVDVMRMDSPTQSSETALFLKTAMFPGNFLSIQGGL